MPVGATEPADRAELRLLIVDGHAYAYRAFHAIRQLSSPDGEPTNAIYGFLKMLGKLRAVLQPTHLVVVWDGGLAPQRLAMLPEYKAQRAAMPDLLACQLDGIGEYLRAAGVASFCREGIEADDWIAKLTRYAVAADAHVVIASSDKDFLQLVSSRVGLYNPNDKSETVWFAEQVRAKTGVEPGQIVDWLSLVGDSVDNIPGVPGVGVKTAADLLRQFGSVEGLYARLGEVKSDRLRQLLLGAREVVARNRELVRLHDEVPGELSLAELTVRPANFERLRELYANWGFKTLLQELDAAQFRQGNLF